MRPRVSALLCRKLEQLDTLVSKRRLCGTRLKGLRHLLDFDLRSLEHPLELRIQLCAFAQPLRFLPSVPDLPFEIGNTRRDLFQGLCVLGGFDKSCLELKHLGN